MRPSLSPAIAVFAAIALCSCVEPASPDAGPTPVDGGPAPLDAGAPVVDAGEPFVDAGPPREHVPPTDAGVAYFADITDDLTDDDLVDALHERLAADHVELSFAGLFAAYETTDTGRGGCAGIFDFYSAVCWDPADACGEYAVEGDCFNREHAWPKSWWGGSENQTQHQDLIAVIPADGFVNGVRGNLPLGDVINADYTSTNGSARGACFVSGAPFDTTCFEPADALKGDLARIYFYMAVRYEAELGCCDEAAVNNADIKAWQEVMLRAWHADDPVDEDERERNERVFDAQANRNPFVDFPSYVDRIADF